MRTYTDTKHRDPVFWPISHRTHITHPYGNLCGIVRRDIVNVTIWPHQILVSYQLQRPNAVIRSEGNAAGGSFFFTAIRRRRYQAPPGYDAFKFSKDVRQQPHVKGTGAAVHAGPPLTSIGAPRFSATRSGFAFGSSILKGGWRSHPAGGSARPPPPRPPRAVA